MTAMVTNYREHQRIFLLVTPHFIVNPINVINMQTMFTLCSSKS